MGAPAAETDETPTAGEDVEDPEADTEPTGDEDSEAIPGATDLSEPETTARVIRLQNAVPMLSTVGGCAVPRHTPRF